MLADTLVVNDSVADRNFVKTKTMSDGSVRINDATTLLEPELLTIRHQTVGGAASLVDRHLVQLSQTQIDDNGVARTAQVNLTIAVPRSPDFTTEVLTRLVFMIKQVITGREANIIRGEG